MRMSRMHVNILIENKKQDNSFDLSCLRIACYGKKKIIVKMILGKLIVTCM